MAGMSDATSTAVILRSAPKARVSKDGVFICSPPLSARRCHSLVAFHARANDPNLEGEYAGKQENQEVVHDGEPQIRRCENQTLAVLGP